MIDGISVVICCYNSVKRIPQVFKHLDKQKEDKNISWEIMLIDNASTDKTADVAKALWSREDVPLHVIYEAKPGLSHARIAGINNSKYEILSFIDDDNWVEQYWIKKIYNIMSNHPNVAILGGFGEPVIESEIPEWFEEFQDAYAVGPQYNYKGYLKNRDAMLYGAGINIRKNVIMHLFKNDFRFLLSGRKGKKLTSGDDSELCFAASLAGYRLFYEPDLRFKHLLPQERLTWKYLTNLIKAFGRSSIILNLYYSELPSITAWRKLKYQNQFLSLLYYTYMFFISIPDYILFCLRIKKSNRIAFSFIYNLYTLLEKLNTIFVFNKQRLLIKKGKWRK